MNNNLTKEIFILVLLFIVIMFVLGILLYDFIPGKKENIKSVEYVADESVSNVLDEIKESTGVDVKENDSNVPLKSYSIEESDLDVYASENSYESGKSDPFSEDSSPAKVNFTKTTKNENSISKVQTEDKSTNSLNSSSSIVTNSISTVENKIEDKVENKTVVTSNTETNSTIKTVEQPKKEESTTGTFFEKKDSK